MQSAEVLRRMSLFSELSDPEIARIRALGRVRRYPARSVVVGQGDETHDLFQVLYGRLSVLGADPSGDEVVLSIMGPGEVFGELALLDGEPRSASVATLELCELFVLEGSAFQQLLREMPALALGLMKVMARRIRHLTDRAKDVSLLDVESRLAKVVLALAARFGERVHPRQTTISLKLSQQDLAGMVGATRELVNRRLRGWAEKGIAEHVGGELTIHDDRALRSLAGDLALIEK